MINVIRYILGYIIGIFIFIILIPYGLIGLSKIDPINNASLMKFIMVRIIIASPFFIVGLFFMIWSNIFLFKAGKGGPAEGFNIAISPKTKKLVSEGPYRYSRNPMVFGAFFLYFSIGLFMFSIICLILLLILLIPAVFYLKNFEEKRLLKDFGNDYMEYKMKVSMIIPFFKKIRWNYLE